MPEFGDLVIVIPGILGSRLEREDGKLLYDLTIAGLPRTLKTLSGKGLSSALGANGAPTDGVVATDLFNFQLLPGFFGNDDYDGLVDALRGCVKQPDRQVIKFPYDWRASNRVSAQRLDQVARSALDAWRKASGQADARLWLVCHSMGGLVARYFCENLGGADITRELITIGTPHRGAAKALDVLVNGMRLAKLVNVSAFVRSLPSAYELLPQYPVLRYADGRRAPVRLAEALGLGERLPRLPRPAGPPDTGVPDGLPNLDRGMLKRALEFHAAIRQPVLARMESGAPSPYNIRCFLNRRQPTVLSAMLHRDKNGIGLEASEDDPFASADPSNRGDGTVAAFSAIPIEWNDTSGAVAVGTKHVGMPASAAVLDVLRNWMRPQDARKYMSAGSIESRDVIGLNAPAVLQQGDGLAIEVDALKAANAAIVLEPVDGNGPTHSIRVRIPGDGRKETLDLGVPSQGTWRVAIAPEDRRRPVASDYVVVLGGE